MKPPQVIPVTWTSSATRSPVFDLGMVRRGVLFVPASWNGSVVVNVYAYTESVGNAPTDSMPKPTSTAYQLFDEDGVEVQLVIAASRAITLPRPMFDARFVAFDSAAGPTNGLTWSIDGKID